MALLFILTLISALLDFSDGVTCFQCTSNKHDPTYCGDTDMQEVKQFYQAGTVIPFTEVPTDTDCVCCSKAIQGSVFEHGCLKNDGETSTVICGGNPVDYTCFDDFCNFAQPTASLVSTYFALTGVVLALHVQV